MSSDKIQFESEMLFDLTKANQQLQQFQKKFKNQQVEVGVKFDKNSAAAVDRLSASITALKQSGKGLDQFNVDMLDLRKNLSAFSNIPAFTKTAQSITQLSNAFLDLKNTARASDSTNTVLQSLGRNLVALGGNAKNISDLGKAMSGIGIGLNGMSRAADNIGKIEAALGRLQKIMVQMKASGAADVMSGLPGNFYINRKGQPQMAPVKIVAPSMDEYTAMKTRWEGEMARRPIRARIAPEMDRTGLQRFQNVLIALSFGQFEANLRRISSQLINNYSQIENAQATLRTVYRNNPQAADRSYKFLSDYEQKTPFAFEEVIRGGTQFAVQETELKRVGFDLERVVRMSGELAAAFNGDISEIQTGISRLLSGDQNGLEILDRYGISRGVLKQQGVAIGPQGLKLNGDADIKAVLDAIEGFIQGKTGGNLAERRGQTTSGVISNLQSQFFKTQAALFEPVQSAFRRAALFATDFMKSVAELPEPIRMLLGGVTLVTSAFLMVAQQASSLGLVLLGMHNAGMFNWVKGAAAGGAGSVAANAVGGGVGSFVGNAAGSAIGGAVGGSVASRLFPTFLKAGAGVAAGAVTANGVVGAGLVAWLSTQITGVASFLNALAGGITMLVAAVGGLVAAIPSSVMVPMVAAAAIALGTLGAVFAGSLPFPGTGPVKAYEDKYTADTVESRALRTQRRADRNLGKMATSDLIKKGFGDLDITKAAARTMQEKQSLQAAIDGGGLWNSMRGGTQEQRNRMAELNKEEEEILKQRRAFRDLSRDENRLQEEQTQLLKNRLTLATQKRDIGFGVSRPFSAMELKRGQSGTQEVMEVTKQQEAQALNKYNALKKAYDKAEASGQYDETALKGGRNAVMTAELELGEATLRRIEAEKDHQKDTAAFYDNIANLRMGTGGTAGEEAAFQRVKSLSMPRNTPDEIRAADAAMNQAEITDYKIAQERKQQTASLAGLRGNTLGQKLQELKIEEQRTLESVTYSSQDRIRVAAMTAQKERQIRFTFYQDLLKMAQDNLQSMHKIETDRLAMLQNVLKQEKALKQASLSRESVEKQYNSQSEVNKMDEKIESGIKEDTALKLRQAKEKYTIDRQKLTSELADMKKAGGFNPKEIKSKERQITLLDSSYGLEKESIKRKGSTDLQEFQQEKKFRKEDLEIEAASKILDDEAVRLANQKEALMDNASRSKQSYVDLIRQELDLERAILINANQKAKVNSKKLTTQEKANLDEKLRADLEKADVAAATKVADSGIGSLRGQAAGLDEVIETEKNPRGKLVNLKKKLELEKQALYLGYLKDAAQPGADQANLQVKYMQDLTDLQQKYLDQAKGITAEFVAQNAELMKRYQNDNGFTMGEVFGLDQLNENMSTDSEYGRMRYDQINIGPKPYNGMNSIYNGIPGIPGMGGGADPFSMDRFALKDRLQTQRVEAMGLPMSGNVPGTLKDLKKVDVKAEFVLKVVTPDGKTTRFSNAVNPDVPPKGKGAQ